MMRMLWAGVVTLALAVLPVSGASAGFYSGNELLELCQTPKSEDIYHQQAMGCLAYTAAIADVLDAGNDVNGYRACTSTGVTQRQLRDIVQASLVAHPEDRQLSAEGIVARALQEAFPCPAKK